MADTHRITVIGTGRLKREPDMLRATVGVEIESDSVDAALSATNQAARRVIDAVHAVGVARADIQTREFRVQPGYDHSAHGTPVLRGYVVRNLVEINVRDLDRVGEVLAAATEAGGNDARVHGVQFELEDDAAVLVAARERAFADARSRAEQYAQLARRELGPLVSLSEDVPPSPHVEQWDGVGTYVATAGGPVPVQPGRLEVVVRVTAVWSLISDRVSQGTSSDSLASRRSS